MIKITSPKPPPFYNRFKRMADEELSLKKTLKKPCKDCAITYGFYTPIADELLKEDKETQDKCMDNWYCHNHTDECCKGVINYVKSMRKRQC